MWRAVCNAAQPIIPAYCLSTGNGAGPSDRRYLADEDLQTMSWIDNADGLLLDHAAFVRACEPLRPDSVTFPREYPRSDGPTTDALMMSCSGLRGMK